MASSLPAVTVVVPTAGESEFLEACLAGLQAQRFRSFETSVVLNPAPARTTERLRRRFPDTALTSLPERKGFGTAANAGASAARSEFLAFLNDDAEPAPDWLAELVACAQRHPRAASIACKVVRRDDPRVLDGAGDSLTFSLKAHRRGLGERDEGQYETEEEVFSASGTACLWRADAFRALGGFDESFFAYYEDVDLGFRARLAGYESWYAPRAVVRHAGAATTTEAWAEFENFHAVRNRWMTIVKNAPARWLLAHSGDIAAGELLSLGRALVLRRAKLSLRAYADVVRNRGLLVRQRRDIQGSARVSCRELYRLVLARVPPPRNALARIDWKKRASLPAPRARDDTRLT